MLRHLKYALAAAAIFLLSACQPENKNAIKVGTIAGPETQLMEVAKDVALKKYGLQLNIVEFSDYMEPNAALSDGSIDANMFQHQPFLDQQIKDHHYKLVVVGKTFLYPMGIYSNKIKNLKELAPKAIVALPNDPSNEGRALLLLQKAGLIQLKNTANLFATPVDVVKNPKQLQFKELDAALIARALADVDIAILNTNYAIPAGLSPTKDAIFHEGSDSPYVNIIVTSEEKVNDPRVQQLVAAIQSTEVSDAAKHIFNGEAIPAWQPKKK